MVDPERVDRLLDRIAQDLRALTGYRSRGAELLTDETALAAVKYLFVTAIEGCTRVAHHIVVAQGWPVAESNAEAVRRLGAEKVLPSSTAEAAARAVGFRNVLVHEYADVDDRHVVEHLDRLGDLETFVSSVAAWCDAPPTDQ